ncbi:MAG: hypothetical protein AB7O38_16695, partial [Pirellulaceae bacterium]
MSSLTSPQITYWIQLKSAVAGTGSGNETVCPESGQPCVEGTIYVPTWTTEKRICKETHYREEQRVRKCIVYKKVPVTKEGVIKTTVYVPKTVETKREIEICTPVCKTVEQKYTIQVPVKDKVMKTRTVTRCVPVTETRTICECGVEKQITVTCNRNVCVEETYECEVDACAEVEQTRQVKVWETKKEMKTVIDRCQTVVPEVRTKSVPVTICEEVPEEKIETYTECVPYEVEKEVEVCVCKMVPQKVAIPCPCCSK